MGCQRTGRLLYRRPPAGVPVSGPIFGKSGGGEAFTINSEPLIKNLGASLFPKLRSTKPITLDFKFRIQGSGCRFRQLRFRSSGFGLIDLMRAHGV